MGTRAIVRIIGDQRSIFIGQDGYPEKGGVLKAIVDTFDVPVREWAIPSFTEALMESLNATDHRAIYITELPKTGWTRWEVEPSHALSMEYWNEAVGAVWLYLIDLGEHTLTILSMYDQERIALPYALLATSEDILSRQYYALSNTTDDTIHWQRQDGTTLCGKKYLRDTDKVGMVACKLCQTKATSPGDALIEDRSTFFTLYQASHYPPVIELTPASVKSAWEVLSNTK